MQAKSYKILVRVVLYVSIGLYIASLTQDCYCTTNSCGEKWQGIYITIIGALGGTMSAAALTWYANPKIWVSWVLLKKHSYKSVFFALAATIVAISFLFFDKVSGNEDGNQVTITGYHLGYWLWVASMLVTLTGSFILYPWLKHIKQAESLQPFEYTEEELRRIRKKQDKQFNNL